MSSGVGSQASVGAEAKDVVRRAKTIQASAAAVVAGIDATPSRVASALDALGSRAGNGPAAMCRIDLVPDDPAAEALVTAVRCDDRVRRELGPARELAQRIAAELRAPLGDAKAATGKLRYFLSGGRHRETAAHAVEHLQRYLIWAHTHRITDALDRAASELQPSSADADGAWADVQARPDWYYRRLAVALAADPDVPDATLLAAEEVLRAVELVRMAAPMAQATARARDAVVPAFHALRSEMVRSDLAKMPVAKLKDATTGRLRLNVIAAAGFSTILDVLDATVGQLQAVDGVGPQTAMQAHAGAQQVAAAVEDDLKFRIDLDPADPPSTRLVQALHRWGTLHRALAGLEDDLELATRELKPLTATRLPSRGFVAFFIGGQTRATLSPAQVAEWLTWADARDIWRRLRSADHVAGQSVADPAAAWADFERRPANYYALLGQLVDL